MWVGESGRTTITASQLNNSNLVINPAQLPKAMPFYLRIPVWATQAVVSVNGGAFVAAPPGLMFNVC